MSNIFEHKLKVRDYECDVQGHVNNANYQHYFEVTRHEFLESVRKHEVTPWMEAFVNAREWLKER